VTDVPGTAGNDRLLYLHVPKTGGHWTLAAMEAAGIVLQHEGGTRHATLEHVSPRDRFTFGFVREPLSWYASWWRHCQVIDPTWRERGRQFPDAAHVYFVDQPFERYVEAVLDQAPGYLSGYYRRFVGPPEAPISFVGRYERLTDDLVRALREAGVSFDEDALRAVRPINAAESAANAEGSCMPETPIEFPAQLVNDVRHAEHEIYERFYPELTGDVGDADADRALAAAGVR
jgi:hypothetical protein